MQWLCFALIMLLALPLVAQSPEGGIVGTVKDASGAVVANANVKITNQGTNAQYQTKTGNDGSFSVPSLPVGSYKVEVAATGFATSVTSNVEVSPGKQASVSPALKVGNATEILEVTAGQEIINTTNTEITNTITTRQVQDLPLLGRDVIGLISLEAAVGGSGRQSTNIAGNRPSWSTVTLDGINIQDIFIHTNDLDFIPNRPPVDFVQEFSVNTGGQGAQVATAASGVAMVTKSGSNSFHGDAYDYNRNSEFAANSWFSNNSGVKRPFRNRNEFGGTVGGPVLKNKLFFFGGYAGIIDRQSTTSNLVIPAHDDLLQGVFRYVRPSDQTIQTVNVLSLLPGVTADSKVASSILSKIAPASSVNNFDTGNSTASRLLNTAGDRINQSNNYNRYNYMAKLDYDLSSNHHLDGSFNWLHEITQRPDIDTFNPLPTVSNDANTKLLSAGWRWTISNTLVNQMRTGFNLTHEPFDATFNPPDNFFINGTAGLSNPEVSFKRQGRDSDIYQYTDDLTWVRGGHTFMFGGQYQGQRVYTWNDAGITPTYTTGFSTGAPSAIQLKSANFPGGISSADLSSANALRAFLGGVISSSSQTFNVTSPTSGFVNGATSGRHLPLNDIGFYGQDRWKIASNVTVTYGLKWEYLSPYDESNGLQLGPVYQDPNNPQATILNPNGTVNFLKQGWNADWNNFGPVVGVAWDVFKTGKTVVRGGYTLTYVNDDTYRFAGNAADGNAGLTSGVSPTGLFATFAGGAPAVPVPTFKMPVTFADQLALSTTNVVWALDPNVQMSKVHLLNFGIEQKLPFNMGLNVYYNGSLGRDLIRGLDLNQTNAGINQPYLADFARARSNLFLCGSIAPASCAQAQTLTFLPTITNASAFFTNSSVIADVQQNAPATLADLYVANRSIFTNAPNVFLPNPGIYAVDFGTNQGFSSYHSLVVDVNRRYKNGLQFQANYTWSKLLTDSPTADNGQTRFDPFLDNARQNLQKGISDLNLANAFKVNALYDLPFGRGKMLLSSANSVVDKIIGGWQLSGIYTLQSGPPFSILAQRGGFNRAGRSTNQTAFSTLTEDQIKQHLGVFRDQNGTMWFIDPSLHDATTGRAVGPDTLSEAAASNFHQVFFNPGAGQVGNLGLLAFQGPAFTDLDLGLKKTIVLHGGDNGVRLELKADAFNLPNHPTFFFGDREINATNFGRITSTNTSARIMQFGMRVVF